MHYLLCLALIASFVLGQEAEPAEEKPVEKPVVTGKKIGPKRWRSKGMFDGLGYAIFNGYRESAKGKTLGFTLYPRAEEFAAVAIDGYQNDDMSNLMNNGIGYGIGFALCIFGVLILWIGLLFWWCGWCCCQCCCEACCCNGPNPIVNCGCWDDEKGTNKICKWCTIITFIVFEVLLAIHLICIVVASFTIPSLLGEMKEGMESSNGQINTVINQIKNISDVIDKVPLLITDFQELIDSYHMGTVIDAMISDNSAINRLRTNLILATENLAVVASKTDDSFMVGQDTKITSQISGLSQNFCNLSVSDPQFLRPYIPMDDGSYNSKTSNLVKPCLDHFHEMLQREKISKDIDITKALNAITAASKQGEKEVKVASKQLFDVISNFSTEVIQLGEDTIKQLIDSSNGIFNALGDHPIGEDKIKSLEDTTKTGRGALQIIYDQIEETKLKYKCSGVLDGLSKSPAYFYSQSIDDLLADFNKKYTTIDQACSALKQKIPQTLPPKNYLEQPAFTLQIGYSEQFETLDNASKAAKGPSQELSDAASAQSNALKAVDIEKMKVNVQTAKDQIAQVNKTLDDAKKPVEETSEQVRTYLGKVNDPLVSIIKQYDDVVVVAKQWVSLASNLLGGFFLFVILLLVLQVVVALCCPKSCFFCCCECSEFTIFGIFGIFLFLFSFVGVTTGEVSTFLYDGGLVNMVTGMGLMDMLSIPGVGDDSEEGDGEKEMNMNQMDIQDIINMQRGIEINEIASEQKQQEKGKIQQFKDSIINGPNNLKDMINNQKKKLNKIMERKRDQQYQEDKVVQENAKKDLQVKKRALQNLLKQNTTESRDLRLKLAYTVFDRTIKGLEKIKFQWPHTITQMIQGSKFIPEQIKKNIKSNYISNSQFEIEKNLSINVEMMNSAILKNEDFSQNFDELPNDLDDESSIENGGGGDSIALDILSIFDIAGLLSSENMRNLIDYYWNMNENQAHPLKKIFDELQDKMHELLDQYIPYGAQNHFKVEGVNLGTKTQQLMDDGKNNFWGSIEVYFSDTVDETGINSVPVIIFSLLDPIGISFTKILIMFFYGSFMTFIILYPQICCMGAGRTYWTKYDPEYWKRKRQGKQIQGNTQEMIETGQVGDNQQYPPYGQIQQGEYPQSSVYQQPQGVYQNEQLGFYPPTQQEGMYAPSLYPPPEQQGFIPPLNEGFMPPPTTASPHPGTLSKSPGSQSRQDQIVITDDGFAFQMKSTTRENYPDFQ